MDDFPIFLSKLIIMLDTSWITSLFIAIFVVSDILLACYGAHLYRRLKRQRLQMRDVPGETQAGTVYGTIDDHSATRVTHVCRDEQCPLQDQEMEY
jgi:hypothetical protein